MAAVAAGMAVEGDTAATTNARFWDACLRQSNGRARTSDGYFGSPPNSLGNRRRDAPFDHGNLNGVVNDKA